MTAAQAPPGAARSGPSAALSALCRLGAAGLLAVVGLRAVGSSPGAVGALLMVGFPVVLLPAYALAAVAAWRRDRLVLAAALVVVVTHVLAVLPGVVAEPVPAPAQSAPRLRVVAANVLVDHPEVDRAAAALRGLRADVLVVAELRPRSLDALRRSGVLADLPHSTVSGPPHDVELFSRLPLRDVQRSRAVPALPQPSAVVDVAGTPVRLRGAHPLPPVGDYAPSGRRSMAALREEVRAEDLPLVVAGDLNGDRHFPLFDDLLGAGLRDAAEERGRGLSRTWPQRLPLLALDHVLVRDGAGGRLVVLHQREAALPGSDHLAVVADLAVVPTAAGARPRAAAPRRRPRARPRRRPRRGG